MDEYGQEEQQIVEKMKKEKDFLARPYKKEACTFCPVANLCDRGVV